MNVSPAVERYPADGDEISLVEIVRMAWRRRYLLMAIVSISTAVGIAYAVFSTPIYRVTVTMVLRSAEDSASGVQAILGQLGVVGGMASGFFGLDSSSNAEEALAWLASRQFGERFIESEGMLRALFPRKWDSSRNAWRSDLRPEEIPTLEDAWRIFDKRIRRIERNRRTGLVTLSVSWSNGDEAARWANLMVKKANEELRQRAIQEADASLKYLQRELDRNTAVELQQAIYRLMEAQIKRKVLANSRPDFIFSVIDPAKVPSKRNIAWPRRKLVVAGSFLGGLILAMLVVLIVENVAPHMRSVRQS